MRYKIVRPVLFCAIVALPVLVFMLSNYLIESFGYYDFPVASADADFSRANGSQALVLRYRFLAMTLAYVVVVAACIMFCVVDLMKRFDRRSLAIVALGFVLIAAIVSVPLFFSVDDGSGHRTHDLLNGPMYVSALEAMGIESGYLNFFEFYDDTITLNKFLGIAVVAFLITSAVAIACSHPMPIPREKRPLLTRLHRQAGDFKRYIYLSSLYLVVGLLQMQSWLKLPAYAFAEKEPRAEFEALADSIVFYYSVTFSLVLVIFALPGLLLLRDSSERLVAKTLEGKAVGFHDSLLEKMKGLGFGLFSVDGIRSIVAILAPVIAGSLDLSKLLSG